MEFFKTHKHLVTAVCAVASLAIAAIAGKDFYDFRHYEEVILPGEGVTSTFQLSDYNENLKGTFGDTTVYVMEGEKEGGSFLVLGGTHPNEPSGHIAALTLIESGKVEAGTVYVIPRTDNVRKQKVLLTVLIFSGKLNIIMHYTLDMHGDAVLFVYCRKRRRDKSENTNIVGLAGDCCFFYCMLF